MTGSVIPEHARSQELIQLFNKVTSPSCCNIQIELDGELAMIRTGIYYCTKVTQHIQGTSLQPNTEYLICRFVNILRFTLFVIIFGVFDNYIIRALFSLKLNKTNQGSATQS